jgi:methionyl-tRNA synthetase
MEETISPTPEPTHASIDDLSKLALRIATIKEAEAVEGSEKLLKLQVDLGDEQRQIVSGIAKSYSPDDLIGRQVVVVSNLAPRTIFGIESNGMLLAASGENGPVLLAPMVEVPSGASVQ